MLHKNNADTSQEVLFSFVKNPLLTIFPRKEYGDLYKEGIWKVYGDFILTRKIQLFYFHLYKPIGFTAYITEPVKTMYQAFRNISTNYFQKLHFQRVYEYHDSL